MKKHVRAFKREKKFFFVYAFFFTELKNEDERIQMLKDGGRWNKTTNNACVDVSIWGNGQMRFFGVLKRIVVLFIFLFTAATTITQWALRTNWKGKSHSFITWLQVSDAI